MLLVLLILYGLLAVRITRLIHHICWVLRDLDWKYIDCHLGGELRFSLKLFLFMTILLGIVFFVHS